MPYEWDNQKNLINQGKHGVSFQEALKAFDDPFLIVLNSEQTQHGEVRLKAIGSPTRGHLNPLLIVFTIRKGNIRIISAHKPNTTLTNLYLTKKYASN